MEEMTDWEVKDLRQETRHPGVLFSISESARTLGSEGPSRKMLGLVLPTRSEGEIEIQDLGKFETGVPELLGFQSPNQLKTPILAFFPIFALRMTHLARVGFLA